MTRVIISGIVKNNNTGKYLIIRRSQESKFAAGKWEFITGFLKDKETAEDAVLNRLNEQTTLTGEIDKRLNIYTIADKDGDWVVIPFLVRTTSDKVQLSKMHSEFAWKTLGELKHIPDVAKDIKNMRF
jgi:ADP-ribose pyrophosphatase YjhB (NUDIX family)